MAVLWNGRMKEEFKPSRGLRQGACRRWLSPYLFVLCIEKLSHLINLKVRNGRWKTVKSGQSCPPISQLFFALRAFCLALIRAKL